MAIKKSELYSSLWKSCDELRGSMDASQYKDYILVLLFVKYVSDRRGGVIVVPAGGGFADMVALCGKPHIGDGINKIIAKLAEANDLTGVIDVADFNDENKLGKGKEMQDRLSKLVAIFENDALNFSKNQADGDDILGDAYEYLMRHFATESGKSKGQFYTPAEVSRVLAKLVGIRHAQSQEQTLYDPTCGSGSLLLKAAEEAPHGITIYGQEMDNATAALAKMNMILHNNAEAVIWQGNTLSNPHFKITDTELLAFDYIVANPPFSTKSWTSGFNPQLDIFGRFVGYATPPEKNGDYAFLLHILKSLKSTGKGAVILPHGVLFRGNAEADIRQNLIRRGYIKAIIGLPPNLFYGTGIPACIIILDKANAHSRTGIFFIDASKDFVKDGNKNRLREQDIRKIVDVYEEQLTLPRYSRMVAVAEVEQNDYNLNIPRYIDNQEAEDIQDIAAHLQGGIPDADVQALSDYWAVYPTLQRALFAPARQGYWQLLVEANAIKAGIFANASYQQYQTHLLQLLTDWQTQHVPLLEQIDQQTHPKQLIKTLSDDLLARFVGVRLIDPYDVYQLLLSYWLQTMQDDVYTICTDGWVAEMRTVEKKKKDNDATPKTAKKLEWDCDLIPKYLVINRYFAQQKQAIEKLEETWAQAVAQREELEEEHNTEDGLFAEARGDNDKLTTASIKARLRAIKGDASAAEEKNQLEKYQLLTDTIDKANKAVNQAKTALDDALRVRYRQLSPTEITQLVVHDKWLTSLRQAFHTELDRLTQLLAQRVQALAQRYQHTLGELTQQANDLEQTVLQHLQTMGFTL